MTSLMRASSARATVAYGFLGGVAMSAIGGSGEGTITVTDGDAESASVSANLLVLDTDGSQLSTHAVTLTATAAGGSVFTGAYEVSGDGAEGRAGAACARRRARPDGHAAVQRRVARGIGVGRGGGAGLRAGRAAGVSPGQLAAGTPLSITVIDLDLNVDPGGVDAAEVTVASSAAGEGVEVLTLTETSPSSGTFTAVLQTAVGSSLAAAGDGGMDANAGDSIVVTYNERAPTAARTVTVPVTPAARGTLDLSPGLVGAGGLLSITVVDADVDQDAARAEDAAVRLVGVAPGGAVVLDTELALRETNVATGVFVGELDTGAAAVPAGTTLTVTYRDAAPLATVPRRARVVASTAGTIDLGEAAGEFVYDAPAGTKVRGIDAGDVVRLRVTDADLNRDPQLQEAAEATVITSRTGQIARVALREAGPDSSEFTGSLRTRAGTPGSGADGQVDVLLVQAGDYLDALYRDAAPAAERRGTAKVRVSQAGALSIAPEVAVAGTVLQVRLLDGDLDTDRATRQSVEVRISSGRIEGGVALLALQETGADTGTFTGEIQSQERVTIGLGGAISANLINVRQGDVVAASYNPPPPRPYCCPYPCPYCTLTVHTHSLS